MTAPAYRHPFGYGPPPEGQWPQGSPIYEYRRGLFGANIPKKFGGLGESPEHVIGGIESLARGDLTQAFVITQHQSAATRLVASQRPAPPTRWLPSMADGKFGTVGISHLTTSRQHTAQPAVLAIPTDSGYSVTGEIPWVTGGCKAQVLVAGASLADGSQILFALPMDRPGIEVAPPLRLLALSGSMTSPVILKDVEVRTDEILGGPTARILQQSGSGGAGSLTTSAAALGHAYNCIDYIEHEIIGRTELQEIVTTFREDAWNLGIDLKEAAKGGTEACHDPQSLRTRATSLALATSQSLMAAAKGAGFIAGHPAERFAREALFFLVWSCPQAVSSRLMREFSGCENSL